MGFSLNILLSLFCICLSAIDVNGGAIQVNQNCFTIGQSIEITFENESPLPGDFIGIYPPDASLSELKDPSGKQWLWTCGTRSCIDSTGISSATLTYSDSLTVGTWKVVLARNNPNGPPHTGLLQSEPFQVRSQCNTETTTTTTTTTPPQRLPIAADTTKQTYNVGETISVRFVYEDPQEGDWIGVYPSSVDLHNLRQAALWTWACKVGCTPLSNFVFGSFNASQAWAGNEWPLAAGTSWIVVLMRDNVKNNNGGFISVSSTLPFTIASDTPTAMTTAQALSAARSDIQSLIVGRRGDDRLAPLFLRLAFHDCVGGCDGCVDLTNPDNNGLLKPIEVLRPIADKYAGTGVSRADIFALAAAVGADVSQTKDRVDFTMFSVGRVNCEDANAICTNEQGNQQACTDVLGPHRILPGMNTNSRELFEFFSKEFGFSIQEGVALMGAHTIGKLKKQNSGVDGPNGWLLENKVLDNGYYKELVGGKRASDPLEVHINEAPEWHPNFVERNNPNGIPDRTHWIGRPNGVVLIMLNADIAMARTLDETNMDKDGTVSCNYIKKGRCPHNELSLEFVIDYAFDNKLWLNDFRDVLLRMLNNGYIQASCNESICFLQPS